MQLSTADIYRDRLLSLSFQLQSLRVPHLRHYTDLSNLHLHRHSFLRSRYLVAFGVAALEAAGGVSVSKEFGVVKSISGRDTKDDLYTSQHATADTTTGGQIFAFPASMHGLFEGGLSQAKTLLLSLQN